MTILKYYTLTFLLYVIFLNYFNILANRLNFNKRINKKTHQHTILSNTNDIEGKENVVPSVHLKGFANKNNQKVDSGNSDNELGRYENPKKKKSINEKLIGMKSAVYANSNNNNIDRDNRADKEKEITLKEIERNISDAPNNENFITNNSNPSDVYFQSFNIYKKPKYTHLNNKFIKSSNIELKNKLNYPLNPMLSLVASKTMDEVLGKVNQHMQGPIPLNSNGNNSPLANPIITPNLYANSSVPLGIASNMPNPNVQPINVQPGGTKPILPGNGPLPNQINGVAPQGNYPPMNTPLITVNPSTISQDPTQNIHPTASNLREDPGNVTYNEVVSITMGIVLSLILFCFVSGCLIKMCKPKKRR